jgi:DNA-binding Lrp family transcriptional regulator
LAGRPLDDVDRRLLAALRQNGRMSVNELATSTGTSRATAYARFDRLQRDGVITGFRADLDPEAIGLHVAAMILVNVDQGAWPATKKRVSRIPGVEYLALTSGGFDFVLFVRAPDIAGLRDVVLHQLQGMAEITSTQTIFVLDEDRQPPGANAALHVDPRPEDGRRTRATRR